MILHAFSYVCKCTFFYYCITCLHSYFVMCGSRGGAGRKQRCAISQSIINGSLPNFQQ